jgi:hypothetical protein
MLGSGVLILTFCPANARTRGFRRTPPSASWDPLSSSSSALSTWCPMLRRPVNGTKKTRNSALKPPRSGLQNSHTPASDQETGAPSLRGYSKSGSGEALRIPASLQKPLNCCAAAKRRDGPQRIHGPHHDQRDKKTETALRGGLSEVQSRCFDQAARAAAFRFLRLAIKPIKPRPPAKSGKVAGSGVGATGTPLPA